MWWNRLVDSCTWHAHSGSHFYQYRTFIARADFELSACTGEGVRIGAFYLTSGVCRASTEIYCKSKAWTWLWMIAAAKRDLIKFDMLRDTEVIYNFFLTQ